MRLSHQWFLQFVGKPNNTSLGPVRSVHVGSERIEFPTVEIPGQVEPLEISFESLAEAISNWPRMYFEWDGSFVWTGDQPQRWQVDGMIYDLNGSIQHIEWKGNCPRHHWLEFAANLRQPIDSLLIHLIDEGCFVAFSDFLDIAID